MKILVVNRGSSSLKCCLYDFPEFPDQLILPLWEAHVQWKNDYENLSMDIKTAKGKKRSETLNSKDNILEPVTDTLFHGETAVIGSLHEIDAAGHRIVHGGKIYQKSVPINKDVKENIRSFSELAPLHNLADLEGIENLESLLPKKPQIAVFDTAFHSTMPQSAVVYPGPYQWLEEGIQRYGFHGISFQYCSKRAAEMLYKEPQKMVICHLGSGASLCAIKEGKSVDTTMGFTPLEGLMMDTRSGTVDPGILLYLLKKKGKSIDDLSYELYENSGLLGLSEISSDMRDIMKKASQGNSRATLTLEVYLHRLKALIGSMIASLGGLDTLVFTAGIGENTPFIRKKICEAFSFLGIKLDEKTNEQPQEADVELSIKESKVKVLLIHTQEAFEIARECWKVLS